jgi:hypothetical protein
MGRIIGERGKGGGRRGGLKRVCSGGSGPVIFCAILVKFLVLLLPFFLSGPGPGSTVVTVESSLSASLSSELELPLLLREGSGANGWVVE